MPLPSQALAPAFSAPGPATPSWPGPFATAEGLDIDHHARRNGIGVDGDEATVAVASLGEARLVAVRVEGDDTLRAGADRLVRVEAVVGEGRSRAEDGDSDRDARAHRDSSQVQS